MNGNYEAAVRLLLVKDVICWPISEVQANNDQIQAGVSLVVP